MSILNGIDLSQATVSDIIHMFFLLDNSGSMMGAPIQTLNEAMGNVLSEVAVTAMKKEVKAMIHVLSFSGGVKWLCGTTAEQGAEAGSIVWNDITTEGNTNTAQAIRSVLPGLSRRLLGHYAYRPIIVLVTDGYSDDRSETLAAIEELNKRQKTIRIAVGVSGYKRAGNLSLVQRTQQLLGSNYAFIDVGKSFMHIFLTSFHCLPRRKPYRHTAQQT